MADVLVVAAVAFFVAAMLGGVVLLACQAEVERMLREPG
jgi:hypothetical protein